MSSDLRREKPPLGSLIKPRMGADGGYFLECCDCGLTHRLDFSITPENALEMRVYAAPDETAQARVSFDADDFLDDPAVPS